MPPLWHPAAILARCRELVPFDDRDAIEVVGEHAGGQQTSHAPTEYDGMLSIRGHRGLLLVFVNSVSPAPAPGSAARPPCDNRFMRTVSRRAWPLSLLFRTLRERGALTAGRAAGEAARRMGRGGGTALPGLVAGTLAPGLVERLAGACDRGAVTVTGTNGKTTTTYLLSAIAGSTGWTPLSNRSGSNLERGLVTAYVDYLAEQRRGDANGASPLPPHDVIGLLEVDEAALPRLFPRLRPRAAVFLNLFRDQLDRYGEVDSIAEGWARMLDAADERGEQPARVLNVDDPSVALLARHGSGRVVGFGIEDDAVALDAPDHASDARFCECGTRFSYDASYMGHVGRWRCEGCGARRPAPEVAACNVRLEPDVSIFDLVIGEEATTLRVPLAGLYSVYNALAAAAAAHAIGISAPLIGAALAAAGPAFGRQERFEVAGRDVRVLLAKNPAGLNELIRVLRAIDGPFTLLAMLNDGIQDGQDVSWIYDADIERLARADLSLVCAGDRADDLALRCAIAGLEPAAVETETERAIDAAIARTAPGGRIEVLATYTAMLDVREALARRAGAASYWEQPRD